jgi:hypothetical protein
MPVPAHLIARRRGRTAVSGKKILLVLGLSLLIVSAIVYTAIIRLKMGGTDALRMRPAPATGAAPSQ